MTALPVGHAQTDSPTDEQEDRESQAVNTVPLLHDVESNDHAPGAAEKKYDTVERSFWKQHWIKLLVLACCTIVVLVILALPSGKPQALVSYFYNVPHMKQTPAEGGNQRALIIASHKKQDNTWLKEVPDDWDIYRYMVDHGDANRKHRNKPPIEDRFRGIPVAKAEIGREAMAYLTYINDHWDHLPPFMVFLHGHDTAWHQPERAIDKIRSMSLASLEEQGWLSIRCSTFIICGQYGPHNLTLGPEVIIHGKGAFDATRALPSWWLLLFGRESGVPDYFPPEQFGGQGGGQFAVTAERVKQRPKSFYSGLLQYLTDDLQVLDDKLRDIAVVVWEIPHSQRQDLWQPMSKYMVGILFEKSWHRMFGMPDHFCPPPKLCYDTWYQGAIHCQQKYPDASPLVHPYYAQDNCTINDTAMETAKDLNAKFLGPAVSS